MQSARWQQRQPATSTPAGCCPSKPAKRQIRATVAWQRQQTPSPTTASAASAASAPCSELHAAIAAPSGLRAREEARPGSLVKDRVLRNRKGLFRIRHLQEKDLFAVAELQASCFHESLPVKPFDELAFTLFKAEVLSAVQKKTKVLADDGFTMLVVEGLASPVGSWSGHSAGGRDAAVWYGHQQSASKRSNSSTAAGSAAAVRSDARPSSSSILGVIEVGVQDEQDVLQHLPQGVETYGYISSMAVAPEVRRCGIGGALLQAAEQQAVLWRQHLVALHVYETNQRAIQLYQSHGLVNHASDPAWRKFVGGKVRQLMVKWV